MWREKLRDVHRAAESLGLSIRETEFHVVPAEQLCALVATGLPGMYHHWSFGRNYERERTRHERGRAVTYELVCNLDPAQAFLLDQNSDAEHLFVCAHVMGHVDLFGRGRDLVPDKAVKFLTQELAGNNIPVLGLGKAGPAQEVLKQVGRVSRLAGLRLRGREIPGDRLVDFVG